MKTTRFVALDTGPRQSGYARGHLTDGIMSFQLCDVLDNDLILCGLRESGAGDVLLYERFQSMGMAVGESVMESIMWAGRFSEAGDVAGAEVIGVTRREVKLSLCNNMRAKDANIRQALIDKIGEPTVPSLEYVVRRIDKTRALRVFPTSHEAESWIAERGLDDMLIRSREGGSRPNPVYGPVPPVSHAWSAIAVAYVGLTMGGGA